MRVGEKRGFDGVLPSRVERVINTLKERGKKGRERERAELTSLLRARLDSWVNFRIVNSGI